jgi:hypothetical protein
MVGQLRVAYMFASRIRLQEMSQPPDLQRIESNFVEYT